MRSVALNVDTCECYDVNISFLSSQNKEVAFELRRRDHIVRYYRINSTLKAKTPTAYSTNRQYVPTHHSYL